MELIKENVILDELGITKTRRLYRFDNGYGISAIQGYGAYGDIEDDTYEVAIIKFTGLSLGYELVYDTPFTDDVIEYLKVEEVNELIKSVKEYNPDIKER